MAKLNTKFEDAYFYILFCHILGKAQSWAIFTIFVHISHISHFFIFTYLKFSMKSYLDKIITYLSIFVIFVFYNFIDHNTFYAFFSKIKWATYFDDFPCIFPCIFRWFVQCNNSCTYHYIIIILSRLIYSVLEQRQVQRVHGGLGQTVGNPVLRGRRAQSQARCQVYGDDVDAFASRWPGRGPAHVRRSQPGRTPVWHDGQLPAVQNAPHHRYTSITIIMELNLRTISVRMVRSEINDERTCFIDASIVHSILSVGLSLLVYPCLAHASMSRISVHR